MTRTDQDLEGAIDELYALPLEEFTAARNRLATELRGRGDRPGAERVKALKKPGVPAWAVNQLARTRRAKLQTLFSTGEQLRAATAAVLRGRGDPEEVRAISARERKQVAALVGEALALLEQGGHATTATYRERIADTLYATAGDAATRGLVEAGRLTTDARRVGFGDEGPDLAVLEGAPPDRGEPAEPDPAERERLRRRERLAVKLRALEEEAARLTEEAAESDRKASDAEQALRRLRAEAERARARADRAAEKAEGTKRELAGI